MALESRSGRDHVRPASVDRRYHTLNRPVRSSIHHTRMSPSPVPAAVGDTALARIGLRICRCDHVAPPSTDRLVYIRWRPVGVRAPTYANTRLPRVSPAIAGTVA